MSSGPLLLIGLVYVIETGSVMLQVTYFKWTKKRYGEGRRIFRMTPFHHHLELGGLSGNGQNWSEWKVDAFMWTIALVTSVMHSCSSHTYKNRRWACPSSFC